MRAILFLLATVITFASTANAATVKAVNGVIVVDGKAITSGGRDSDPVPSPDGKRVVFVRDLGGKPLNGCAANGDDSNNVELWSIGADGRGARKLLGLQPADKVENALCNFNSLQFSSNGRRLYFETAAWATSDAIHVYDFATDKERYFLPGNGVQVLSHCAEARYRDDLIVSQHRYFAFAGSFDWLWLFAPDGKEIGPVGEDVGDLKDVCG